MKKTTKRFIGLLLALIILVGTFYLVTSDFFSQKKTNPAFPQIKKETITKLVLIDSQNTLTLAKNNNKWSLDVGGEIDESKINTLIDSITSINKDNLVSTNKDKQVQLEIGIKKIEFYTGALKNTFYLGKNFDLNKVYFKTNNEEKIYSTNNTFDEYFSTDFLIVKKADPTPTVSPTY